MGSGWNATGVSGETISGKNAFVLLSIDGAYKRHDIETTPFEFPLKSPSASTRVKAVVSWGPATSPTNRCPGGCKVSPFPSGWDTEGDFYHTSCHWTSCLALHLERVVSLTQSNGANVVKGEGTFTPPVWVVFPHSHRSLTIGGYSNENRNFYY